MSKQTPQSNWDTGSAADFIAARSERSFVLLIDNDGNDNAATDDEVSERARREGWGEVLSCQVGVNGVEVGVGFGIE